MKKFIFTLVLALVSISTYAAHRTALNCQFLHLDQQTGDWWRYGVRIVLDATNKRYIQSYQDLDTRGEKGWSSLYPLIETVSGFMGGNIELIIRKDELDMVLSQGFGGGATFNKSQCDI